jgi:hypothetical protein
MVISHDVSTALLNAITDVLTVIVAANGYGPARVNATTLGLNAVAKHGIASITINDAIDALDGLLSSTAITLIVVALSIATSGYALNEETSQKEASLGIEYDAAVVRSLQLNDANVLNAHVPKSLSNVSTAYDGYAVNVSLELHVRPDQG